MFEFVFDLDCKVAIYVPSTFDAVNSADNSEIVKNVLRRLCNLFGGATSSQALGGWMSPKYGLITENVTICYSYCKTEDLRLHASDIINICQDIKNEMKQEAVTLEINGQVKFI